MTQVQTEIDRLESAKQAIASAIADKGVTVPSGTMLDGMAALIESIEAGGGNPTVVIPDAVLNANSWEEISAVSASGQAANVWAVGDTKQVVINGKVGNTTFDNLSVWVFILGFNHNSAMEGNNTIHFQIGKTNQVSGIDIALVDSKCGNSVSTTAGYFNMNYSQSTSGGWESCTMRTTLLGNSNTATSPLSGSLIAALPSDLRAVMKSVTKYSNNVGTSDTVSAVTATTDYLWLLSEFEVFGTRKYGNSAEQNYQKQYTYYANGNSKVFYKHSDTSSKVYWFLRSASTTTSGMFLLVRSTGAVSSSGANSSYGVAPSFCV